jgi:dolichyl-phosphate-mannose-protein mannosyltransferase
MSSQGSVRKRKDVTTPAKTKEILSGIPTPEPDLDALVKANINSRDGGAEWDYRAAIAVITVLAFITRFWGISHPNEVVFDEVHFGKVSKASIPENTC